MIKSIILASLLILIFSCVSNKPCHLKKIETIFFDKGKDNYMHYVLIENFERDCMDSITMVNLAKKYSDTVTQGRPALKIKLYNSDSDFIPNEVSQVMNEIDRSCLVHISFNKAKEPIDFVFYDENGDIVYWGTEWKPNGE